MQTETIASPVLSTKRVDMFKVPSTKLRIKDGLNIRTDYGDLDELSASIKEHGIKVPLRGYKEKDASGEEVFIVVDGHRRYAACQILIEEGVEVLAPFILESKGYSDEQRLIDMFIMNEGKALNPLEQAEGVRRLIAYGYSEKQIAGKLAKSEGYIRKLNSLNSAPQAFKKLIEDGTISATLAISAIAEGKVEEIMKKVEAGTNNNSTVIVAEDTNAQDTQSNDGKQITAPTSNKITKKDLQTQNSVKEMKKFMKQVESEDEIDVVTLPVYQFVDKLLNNQLSYVDIQDFFTAGK